ncbi:fungal-specific transcription factor domain-containing protein [Aspergillus karnatakaensis]|uniref:Zn(II)2Cys6 transcription factor n=1 Tax=Aspergillus karnatakaensis TaxID=1810916 RepID=UPI003CCCE866
MSPDRLPLSPSAETPPHQVTRKRKSNSERVRVTRACDRCKRRKIKCNNSQPCQFCIRAKARCTFDSSYARGRKFLIPPGYDEETPTRQSYSAILPSPVTSQEGVPSTEQSHHDQISAEASSRNSPEPSQTDLQGHYIGPASGVSFLLRVQKRLHQAISFSQPSSIFTFGDAPLNLPEFDPSFCMMLPRDDAQRLIDRYFDFAMPTYRFLHRPTIQDWFNEFYDTLGVMRDTHSAPAKVALLFMVFSLARVYMPDNDRPGPTDLSARYYLAAEHQLTKEKGSIRLTSVQARLTQCYYLLTQSRINHCWSLFGTVSHLALAIGLNRNRRADPGNGMSTIETECRRRTFWCAYTLDAYLSAALGRPRSFHDDDIDTELPACVEDHELGAAQTNTNNININIPLTSAASSRTLTTMLAPLAHMKIARIISRTLRDLYSIKPSSETRRGNAVKIIHAELTTWRADLAWFLDADILSASLIMPIFQRQRNVLNLTYWHSIILAHRPFVLSDFARLSLQNGRENASGSANRQQTEESVRQCLNAAMKTVDIIDEITQNRQLFRALWITSYFAFNATIMLYIYVIQNRAYPADTYKSYFSAASRCQSHLSAIAEKGSLSERYCLVLEELRVEATRQTRDPSLNFSSSLVVSGSGHGASHAHAHAQSQSQSQHQTHSHSHSHSLAQTHTQTQAQDHAFGSSILPLGTTNSPNTIATSTYTDSLDDTGNANGIDFTGGMAGAGVGGLGFSLSDASGWGQFTSMVSSGLGNLDLFFGDEVGF